MKNGGAWEEIKKIDLATYAVIFLVKPSWENSKVKRA